MPDFGSTRDFAEPEGLRPDAAKALVLGEFAQFLAFGFLPRRGLSIGDLISSRVLTLPPPAGLGGAIDTGRKSPGFPPGVQQAYILGSFADQIIFGTIRRVNIGDIVAARVLQSELDRLKYYKFDQTGPKSVPVAPSLPPGGSNSGSPSQYPPGYTPGQRSYPDPNYPPSGPFPDRFVQRKVGDP
jgi:hypothetical protein